MPSKRFADRTSMLEIEQFRNKITTHGLFLTLSYSAEFVVRPLWRKLWVEPFLKSYSQRYEDMIIDSLLGDEKSGTYLDIGAYDPHILSNTKRFHDRGWRGCNVEPNPPRFQKFVRARPNDINLNVGLSDAPGKLIFFDVARGAFSTFSEERARELKDMGAQIRREIEIPVMRMEDVFEQYFKARTVDFCSIDTEGMDLAILRGNDWSRFRPRILCVEVSVTSTGRGDQQPESVEEFLLSVGYRKYTQTYDFGVPLNEIYIAETQKAK
jgi:FkbM family methyltransferase